MKIYDVIILGAGAAGLKAASVLVSREKSVLIIDMGDKPARKIAVSGGGRCNFTNTRADYTHYFGKNPQFVRSALTQWSPLDTLNWVRGHRINIFEKEPGRYFCKNSSEDIINALLQDIDDTEIKYNTNIQNVQKTDDVFHIKTDKGEFSAKTVIVATGGLSYPHLGVSNIGHVIAKQFGHKIEPIKPALCAVKTGAFHAGLAGISLIVQITTAKGKIKDDLLFTHFGLGGPAIYRATLFDYQKMSIDFAPNLNVYEMLKASKQTQGTKSVSNILLQILPKKLSRFLSDNTQHIADLRDEELKVISEHIKNFEVSDAKPVGLQSAEVTAGGVSVDEISSKTMESKLCDGLFFAGEVMDITGDLGGYNLQWAFSSGHAAGLNA